MSDFWELLTTEDFQIEFLQNVQLMRPAITLHFELLHGDNSNLLAISSITLVSFKGFRPPAISQFWLQKSLRSKRNSGFPKKISRSSARWRRSVYNFWAGNSKVREPWHYMGHLAKGMILLQNFKVCNTITNKHLLWNTFFLGQT